jgi:hypothetical protein
LEPRLRKRYTQLVQQHLRGAGPLTGGVAALPGLADGFASVQAAWRFFRNDAVSLPALAEPLLQVARLWRQRQPDAWGLVIHDWSALSYPGHAHKADQTQLTNRTTRGYQLATALLVEGTHGDPVAPLELRLRTADAVVSTRTPAPDPNAYAIDEVLPTMRAVADRGLGERLVHVIDREADSLSHYRDWQAEGFTFLVRADAERGVRWQGEEVTLAEIHRRLHARGRFRRSREVLYKGQKAVQHVAEVEVVLDRPAYKKRRQGDRVVRGRVPGPPLTLRLVVSRVCDGCGETVAVWYLLTNLPATVAAAEVALWYYWRWRIESFFKLLKSDGQQVEHWQQHSGGAIAKRLLVAAMACAVVWALQRQTAPEAVELRQLLVGLSGRQMAWGKESTAPALLAGLWVYLTMLEALETHGVEKLRALKKSLSLLEEDTS